MRVVTSDHKRSVDVGSSAIWISVYSTVMVRAKRISRKIPRAIQFLKTGACAPADCMETARQINLIRDELANFAPEKAVYDIADLSKKAPWGNKISPVITSCANLYTTADGKDLLFELVSILTYGAIAKVSVSAM